MPDVEVFTKVIELTTRIHVITGWTLPQNPDYLKILAEEFAQKLQEDFADMNFNEVLNAFRRNGIGIKDWGKSMNLSLITEVLDEYIKYRLRLSEEEERVKKPEQKTYTLEELEDFQRENIEAFYQRLIRGVLPPSEFPPYFHTILVKDGIISADSNDLHAFFANRLNKGFKNIYLKIV